MDYIDNFRYLLETHETSKLMIERVKQKRIEWSLGFFLFVDSRKKKDNRRLDFNILCYYDILCDFETKQKIKFKLADNVFILPIKTDLYRDFYFVSLKEIPASIRSIFENT